MKWAVLGLTLLLSGVVAAAEDDQTSLADVLAEQTGQNGRACVRENDIRGYGYRERDRLLTIDARGGYFLATTLLRCHELAATTTTAFNGRMGDVCGGGASSVGLQRGLCPIGKVFKFANRKAAFTAIESAKLTIAEAENGSVASEE